MNVAEFANRVTGAIGIDAATANSATSNEYTLFLSWLNEAVEQFLLKTKMFKQTASLGVTADVGDYTIDSSILAFEDGYYTPNGGQARMLDVIDSYDIRRMRIATTSTDSDPRYLAYEGQQIFLYPTPRSTSDTLHLIYVPQPASTLAATADTPATTAYGGIPVQYHHVLESYVKWKAAEYTNDKASQGGSKFMQEFDQGCIQARVTEQRRAGMRWGRASIGKRDWRWYAGPGVDVG